MADISIQSLSHPVTPRVKSRTFETKNFENTEKNSEVNLQSKKLIKTHVQVLPPGVHKKPIKIDNKFIPEQKAKAVKPESTETIAREIIDKQRELEITSSELQSVAHRKRQIEAQVQQLNSELDKLRESEKDVQIQNAEFRLNKDEDEFYVELLDTEDGAVIKELTLDDMEKVLDKASGNAKGVLLDLFA